MYNYIWVGGLQPDGNEAATRTLFLHFFLPLLPPPHPLTFPSRCAVFFPSSFILFFSFGLLMQQQQQQQGARPFFSVHVRSRLGWCAATTAWVGEGQQMNMQQAGLQVDPQGY